MPELVIEITSLIPKRMGEEVELEIRMGDSSHSEKQKLTVASKMLFEIGNIGVNSLPYAIDREQYETLEYSAKLWECIKKGLDLLSYASSSKSALKAKLCKRGFDKYIAEDAAEYIANAGYINESAMLEKTVRRLADVNLYGKQRIKAELFKKGISKDVISENLEIVFEEIDFEANLHKLIEKKCDFDRLDDIKYKNSFIASIVRYGYSVSDTVRAIRELGIRN